MVFKCITGFLILNCSNFSNLKNKEVILLQSIGDLKLGKSANMSNDKIGSRKKGDKKLTLIGIKYDFSI